MEYIFVFKSTENNWAHCYWAEILDHNKSGFIIVRRYRAARPDINHDECGSFHANDLPNRVAPNLTFLTPQTTFVGIVSSIIGPPTPTNKMDRNNEIIVQLYPNTIEHWLLHLEYKKFAHCKDINSYKSLASQSKVNISDFLMFE